MLCLLKGLLKYRPSGTLGELASFPIAAPTSVLQCAVMTVPGILQVVEAPTSLQGTAPLSPEPP